MHTHTQVGEDLKFSTASKWDKPRIRWDEAERASACLRRAALSKFRLAKCAEYLLVMRANTRAHARVSAAQTASNWTYQIILSSRIPMGFGSGHPMGRGMILLQTRGASAHSRWSSTGSRRNPTGNVGLPFRDGGNFELRTSYTNITHLTNLEDWITRFFPCKGLLVISRAETLVSLQNTNISGGLKRMGKCRKLRTCYTTEFSNCWG